MAKRGESYPFLVRYVWPNGVKGSKSCMTRESAEYFAEEVAQNGRNVGSHVAIVIIERGKST